MIELDRLVLLRHGTKVFVEKMDPQLLCYCDLTFVHEGRFDYRIDDSEFIVKGGEAMFCPAGSVRFRDERQEPALYTSLNFTVSPQTQIGLPCHILSATSVEINFYLKQMIQVYYTNDENKHEKCRALLCLILFQLCDQNHADAYNAYINKIKQYISLNLNKKIHIADISDHVSLNPSYCSTLFKKQEGISISDYIAQTRISYAKKMLAYENLQVCEIAEETGFCDVFYFCRVFKKHTGLSPGVYRKKVRI